MNDPETAVVAWRLQHADCGKALSPPCICGSANARGVDISFEPEDFVRPHCRYVWRALDELERSGIALDMVALAARLGSMGVLEAIGGVAKLGELAALDVASFEIKPLVAIVRETARRLRLVEVIADAAARLTAGDDPADVAEALRLAK